jgi:flagellar protein FlaG
MKTTPTAEIMVAQAQVVTTLGKRSAVQNQDEKQPVAVKAQAVPVKVGVDETKQAVTEVNAILKSMNHHLQFSIDDRTNTVIVKLIDGETGEVIRQIPPEEIVRLRAYYRDQQGLLVNMAV